jgi:hypothetical protein
MRAQPNFCDIENGDRMLQERNETVLLLPLNSTDHVLGPASAAVTVIEYGDFECPYCRTAYPAVKILLKHFADRVRFVFRHFPVVDASSPKRAAESAETAGAQGRFGRCTTCSLRISSIWGRIPAAVRPSGQAGFARLRPGHEQPHSYAIHT